jgi:TatD DNase family protein
MTDWFIDTHCHLDLLPNIQQSHHLEDALPIKTISVTNAPSFFTHSQRLFHNAKNVRIAVGLHPELVTQFHGEISVFRAIMEETRYIGEIGLDGSDRFRASFSQQRQVFTSLLKLCAEANNKVITVHTRNAEQEAVQSLRNLVGRSDCKVILHWFSGSAETLKDAISAGFYLSVNHKMTKTRKGQEVIKRIPIGKLLTETDAPFTLDAKMTRLQSLQQCLDASAEILQMEPEQIKREVLNNFRQLLG